jgi:hypothetical protein
MPAERNQFTARERGLAIGRKWAELYEGDVADLRPVAGGEISPDVREAIESLLVENDIEDPTAFWDGFVDGVRALIAERAGGEHAS